LLLAACAAPRPAPPPTPALPDPPPETLTLPPEEQAQAWLVEAESTPAAAPARRAIDAVLDLPDPEGLLPRAERLWSLLPEAGRATLGDRHRGALLALLQGERPTALERLEPVHEDPDPTLSRDALELHASLLTDAGRYREALGSRVRLDLLLLDVPDYQMANQASVWTLLSLLDPDDLIQLQRPESDIRLLGWAALLRALRTAGTAPDAFDAAIQEWSRAYPGHPAQARLAVLRAASVEPIDETPRIAVLLPLTGPLGELGRATLEGISAATGYSVAASKPLLIFDTEGSPDLAEAAFRQAINQGADRVIGPLTREEVDRVLSTGRNWPTLLLNRPSTTALIPFSVLSLSPEEDARVAARAASSAGQQQALILVPEGTFGDRVAEAFRDAFTRRGGRIAGEHRFQARSPELNAEIGAALGVDASRERIATLARALRLELEGDPQIRTDIDAIFVTGPARDLRMVAPHLHYHRAGRLPMWATSHAYEGQPQPALDLDLNGIRFPDVPWLYPDLNPDPELKQRIENPENTRSVAARLPRFTALGIDAGRITAEWPRFRNAPHLEVRGAAGNWRLHPLEQVWYREPAWLEFRDGRPQPMQAINSARENR
jgi:outer membrane PBP1 activator LpoA protein